MLVTRALSRRMHPVPLQFHTALLAALICIPLLALGTAAGEASTTFQLPQGVFWLWVFCVGLASAISHMAITYALKFAPSSTLAPLHYLEIVTATLFGYLVFGNFPNLLTLSGIAVIVTSGLYVIHRERVTARARRLTSREAVLAQR
jgi:drug/metabolite transporter (DMT)-like permease